MIADEPTTALEVTIQAQILELVLELRRKMGMAVIWITHDLGVIAGIADRVVVMCVDKIVELAPRDALYEAPLHPYTEALLSAVPHPDPAQEATRERIILKGEVPSPSNPPKGCNFCTRYPKVKDICHTGEPEWQNFGDGHFAACHLID